MFINENGAEWRKMLTENFNVTDQDKLNWVSQYAAIHEIKESVLGYNGGNAIPGSNGVSPMYATPLNTMGMGGITTPSQLPVGGGADNGVTAMMPNGAGNAYWGGQTPGSGDIPVSTLPMALNIALMTIGLELLPVIPAKSPFQMLSYLDFPYAGGKMNVAGNLTSLDGKGEGKENKPIYVKFLGKLDELAAIGTALKAGNADAEVNVVGGKTGSEVTFKGKFKGIGRNDGGILLETVSCTSGTGDNLVNEAISEVVKTGTITIGGTTLTNAKVDFVQTSADLIDGFANFATGAKSPMTRAENETGTGNTIGLRLFTQWVQVGSYEVTGTVTRQQLQDLPLYGIDAVGKVMEAMQNEITQHINQRILERVFRLGVTNAVQQKAFQGVDLNLYLGQVGSGPKALSAFGIKEYKDMYGVDHAATWQVANSEALTSAENNTTRQRRIASRVLAAGLLIQNVGRRGPATWIVTNTKVAAALKDSSAYVVAPMDNTLGTSATANLYQAGTLGGLKVYVDPYMQWNDTRICVGRKGDGNSPGLIFMPYILADTVSITAEGTMAPKMLVNSRFAITEIGFYPELQYFTFAVNSDFDII